MPAFRATEPKLQMTPMIDVVFLLLIFFMISTTFIRRSPDAAVTPPTAKQLGDRPMPGRALVLNIRRGGEVTIDQQVVPAAKLKDRIAATGAAVIIRADARAPHACTLRVLEACAGAGRAKVKLIVVRGR